MLTEFPSDLRQLAACRPVYESLPGWTTPTHGVRSYDDLPRRGEELHRAAGGGDRRAGRHHLDRLRAGRHDLPGGLGGGQLVRRKQQRSVGSGRWARGTWPAAPCQPPTTRSCFLRRSARSRGGRALRTRCRHARRACRVPAPLAPTPRCLPVELDAARVQQRVHVLLGLERRVRHDLRAQLREVHDVGRPVLQHHRDVFADRYRTARRVPLSSAFVRWRGRGGVGTAGAAVRGEMRGVVRVVGEDADLAVVEGVVRLDPGDERGAARARGEEPLERDDCRALGRDGLQCEERLRVGEGQDSVFGAADPLPQRRESARGRQSGPREARTSRVSLAEQASGVFSWRGLWTITVL